MVACRSIGRLHGAAASQAAVLLLLTLCNTHLQRSLAQAAPAVRLVDSSGNAGATSGRLEVYRCAWSSLCLANFNFEEAAVSCRQMGLGATGEATTLSVPAGESGIGPILMELTQCAGSEDSLDQCSSRPSQAACTHSNDVSTLCLGGPIRELPSTPTPPVNGSMRLVTSSNLLARYPRQEIFRCGWSTICRSGFDDADASVACRELGLGGTGTVISGRSPGTGPIWVSDFECSGQEALLEQCPNATSTSSCSHTNDVIVRCGAAADASQPSEPTGSSSSGGGGASSSGSSSSSSSSGSSSSSSSSSSAALIGAIAGAASGAALLGLLAWWYVVRRRKARSHESTGKPAAPPEPSELEEGKSAGEEKSAGDDSHHPEGLQSSAVHGEIEPFGMASEKQSDGQSVYPATPSAGSDRDREHMLYASRSSTYTNTTGSIPSTGSREWTGRGRSRGGSSQRSGSSATSLPPSFASDRVVLKARLKMLSFSDILILRQMAEGTLGKVYLARWHEVSVAVKVFDPDKARELAPGQDSAESAQDKLGKRLQKHSGLLASLRHPCLVSFLGMCADPPSLVCEYCPRGSLAQVLQVAAASPEQAAKLDWLRRLRMLLEAARGLLYLHLHNPPIVHSKLSSSNLLVDQEWTVKVSDFDIVSGTCATPEMKALRLPWLAPELLGSDATATLAGDVYAYGVVMWQMATWQQPWEDSLPEQVAQAVAAGTRPSVPDPSSLLGGSFGSFEQYTALMQQCWDQDPAARPGFGEVIAALRAILEAEGGTDEVVIWSPFTQATSSQWTQIPSHPDHMTSPTGS